MNSNGLKSCQKALIDLCSIFQGDLSSWYKMNKCKVESHQMIKDLAPWSNGVKFAEKLAKAEKLFANPGAHAWCHYVIKVVKQVAQNY